MLFVNDWVAGGVMAGQSGNHRWRFGLAIANTDPALYKSGNDPGSLPYHSNALPANGFNLLMRPWEWTKKNAL
jgi:hypothetical protein